jgi:PAS domain S-box-containing protein
MNQESLLGRSMLKWLDASGHMFMDLDRDFRLVVVSTILREVLGAVEGETCYGSMYGLEDPCPGCPIVDLFQGKEKAEADFARKDRSGQYRHLRLTAVPVLSPRGEVLGARALIMDVTGEKTSQLPADHATTPGGWLHTHTPDLVFTLDQTGRFTFVNMAVHELLGYPVEEILGTAIWDLAVEDDRPTTKRLLEVHGPDVWDAELEVLDAHGAVKHVRVRCSATADKRGKTLGFTGVMRDRTAQRKMEEELKVYQESLRESEQRYRSLVEEVPDILFSLDASGRFSFVNSQVEELLGHSVTDTLDRYFWDYVTPEYQALAGTILTVRPGTTWDEELWVVDAHGETKWVRVRCRPHTDRQGRITEYEGVMRDRTTTKKLEDDLKGSKLELMDKIKIIDDLYQHIVQAEKSKAIAAHTAEVAHELRQPLAIIGGFARRMSKHLESCKKLDPDSQRECIHVILREVERLERILTGLINFTELNPVQVRVVNPSDLIEDVLHLYEERLTEKDLRLQLLFGEEMTEITVDPHRFHQLVRNLVSNAIDASPVQGIIRIETGVFIPSAKAQATGGMCAEAYFEMKVTNTGPVIPAEDLQKVFDPFYTTKDFAMGIGLTLSKKIVEEHNGSISAKSGEEGTTFGVWLPLKSFDLVTATPVSSNS